MSYVEREKSNRDVLKAVLYPSCKVKMGVLVSRHLVTPGLRGITQFPISHVVLGRTRRETGEEIEESPGFNDAAGVHDFLRYGSRGGNSSHFLPPLEKRAQEND